MSDYRAIFVGTDGHVLKFVPLNCDTDTAAIAAARKLLDGHNIEIWEHDRKVIKLEHQSENPGQLNLVAERAELLEKAVECRRLAAAVIDPEIEGKLIALAEECEGHVRELDIMMENKR
jgi:hypothetical protein